MPHTVPIARARDPLNRRAFLGVVTGGLLAAPLVTEAQPVGRALGLTIPPALLQRADQVIE